MLLTMPREYIPYIPQTIGEIYDLLGSMMLSSPTFVDRLGNFPERNIDTVFATLNQDFGNVRKQLGEDRYAQLIDMADRMRAHFEADPEDKTADGAAGRQLIYDMEDVLKAARARKPRAAGS